MAASLLCLIHCVVLSALPAVVALLGLSFLKGDHFHAWLALLILASSAFAFIPGFRRHRRRRVLFLMSLGLLLVLSGAFVTGAGWSERWETPLTIAGGLCLVTAHFLNRRFCRYCQRCAPSPGRLC
jgi:hypothetical protein